MFVYNNTKVKYWRRVKNTMWSGKGYISWAECQDQIRNFPGAVYKSFKTDREATNAFLEDPKQHIGNNTKSSKSVSNKAKYIYPSISVDAACSGNPGDVEYQGVDTKTKKVIFKQGPFGKGTNNIGEFLALVHALALYSKKYPNIPIYTDSKTAQAWVRNKKVKTTLKQSKENTALFELIERAISWLNTNQYSNPILKWDTKSWGEIPADFGRK